MRTHHAPVGVVELAGLGLFPFAAQGRVEPTEVGERGRVRQAVQHLFFGGVLGVGCVGRGVSVEECVR